MHKTRFVLAALASPLARASEPVHLIPDGVFRATDGRPAGLDGWRLDADIAAALLTQIRRTKTRLPINYEHPTPNGQPMPAAGWIERDQIRYEPGVGLTAPAAWTDRAKAMIDAGEYAYLSPVISYDPKTGAVRDLHLAGLTNTPALDSLAPLAKLAATLGLDLEPTEEPLMDLAALRQKLGLTDDADESAILAKIDAITTDAGKVAALTDQVASLSAKQTPDLSQYVPKAVHDEAVAALKQIGQASEAGEIDRLIETGLSSGKIPGKATADWLKGQGLAALRQYLDDAPALAALTQTQTGRKNPPEDKGEQKTAMLTADIYAQRRAAIAKR